MADSKRERMQGLGLGLLFTLFGLLGITYAVVSWIKDNPVLSKPAAIGAALIGLLFVVLGAVGLWRWVMGK